MEIIKRVVVAQRAGGAPLLEVPKTRLVGPWLGVALPWAGVGLGGL